MERMYHIGVLKRKSTIVVQASTNVDCLSCEIRDYYGIRITTKANLKANKLALLSELKHDPYYKDCDCIVIE